MFKKYLVLGLTILVINLSLSASVFAETKEEKATKLAEKVKANITKLGTGRDARIEIKLKDGTKLKGYVGQIDENSFVVVNEKIGTPTEVPYAQTKQVKGSNLSTGAKIAIGAGIGVALFLVLYFVGRSAP